MKNISSFFAGHSQEQCLTTSSTLLLSETGGEQERQGLREPPPCNGRTRKLRPSHRYASMLSQSLLLGVIAAVGLFSNSFSENSKAYPQTPPVNNTEINSYAQAVLAMEPARQHAFEEIKKMIGTGEIPQIICNDPNSINRLPQKAQDIAVNYCVLS